MLKDLTEQTILREQKQYYEAMAPLYGKWIQSFAERASTLGSTWNSEWAVVDRALSRDLPSDGWIGNMGSGCIALNDCGGSVVNLDYSCQMLRGLAEGSVTQKRVLARIETMPFADRTLMAVILKQVLSHMTDSQLRVVLQRSLKALAEGGLFFVTDSLRGFPGRITTRNNIQLRRVPGKDQDRYRVLKNYRRPEEILHYIVKTSKCRLVEFWSGNYLFFFSCQRT